jgi:hypothetical protein
VAHQREAVLPHMAHLELRTGHLDARQPLHQGCGLIAGNPPGPAILDQPLRVQSAEVAAPTPGASSTPRPIW